MNDKKKDGRGNPNFKAKRHKRTKENADLIKSFVRYGVRHEYICSHLGITKPTLYKYYKKEIAEATIYAHTKVGKSIFDRAIAGDMTAAIFYAKTQMGWKERVVNEIVGNQDEPLEIVNMTPAQKLTNFLQSINEKNKK
jgi:hypothetical protein